MDVKNSPRTRLSYPAKPVLTGLLGLFLAPIIQEFTWTI